MNYSEKEIKRQMKIIKEYKEKGWTIKDIACVAEVSEYIVRIRLEEMDMQRDTEGFASKFKKEWDEITRELRKYNLSHIQIVSAEKVRY